MPIQDFNIYTARGYAGDLVDSGPRTTQTGVVEAATLAVGVAVQRGTVTTNPRHVVVGHNSGAVFGISMRDLAVEAKNKPSDGETEFRATESVNIIREGFLYVRVTVRAAVAGALLNVVDATGAFTGGAAGGGETLSLNVRAEQSGAVGDIIKVRVDVNHS